MMLRCRNLPRCAKLWPLSHCWKSHNLFCSPRQPLFPRMSLSPAWSSPTVPWYWHCHSLSEEHLMPAGEA